MFSSTLVQTAFFVALAVRSVAAADLTIQTPTLTQCQDATLTWAGGEGTYGVYVVPSDDPCADSVVDIPEQNEQSYKWKVNLPAGAKVELLVEDATGAEAWSGIVTVQGSKDSSCVDSKAAQALAAANGPSSAASSSAASSNAGPSSGVPTPSTTFTLPSGAAAAKTVVPASGASDVANIASDSNSPSSGSIPRATLSVGSFVAITAFALALVQL